MKNQLSNLQPASLVEQTIVSGQGKLSSSGALVVKTGKFTGRSPKDRFIVKDARTEHSVDWGDINIPIDEKSFETLYNMVIEYSSSLDKIYVRDAHACANPNYRLNVRVYTEYPWQNLFVYNMFLRPTAKDLASFTPEWKVYSFPGVLADPKKHNTRQDNFSIINFSKKVIIIGGSAYTGEIKKGIFSVLNYLLPTNNNVLPMHCSANVGAEGDTALFFGLSGTGKTTLSNDPERRLIGDDEHGWSKESVFNFEGGCYAKTIDLSPRKEPQIYKAIKFGALLENVGFEEDGCTVDYENVEITQNTRVSYPIYHIDNIMFKSRGDIPENIFFLTCDAFGVLPPISRLTPEQAMYHFISGYTAKIAGTEEGINEPEATFSACFGAPFLPLNPTQYAELLGKKLKQGSRTGDGEIHVWLVNTGWTGGAYGEGSRMELSFTRAMIKAALTGELNEGGFHEHPIFGMEIPKSCPDVPNAVLNPRDTWRNEKEYDKMAKDLAKRFVNNFEQYKDKASSKILKAAPKV
ncbi:phosphoenolpyruvate carboxykinase (ATP) [Saprospiraceae bacterium]|jgi:phosphoenolpyruvate carboxykinase (ATP)|nr:phosphoenolpyruvate carboxykinase (ATP) [Bacteroidota bacterium]MDB4727310.1 phosphoenolpyruvate carboxykinase (ATP) [Saprospiraceae bacterium]MDF1863988.1 phosphoenolpyruvate carboxykinase (ATP) [Saprospiraceae bacterium]